MRLKPWLLACGLGLCTSTLTAKDFSFEPNIDFQVPEIGSGIGLLDQQNEKMIGEKVYREVRRHLPTVQNPWLEDQLYSVFAYLLSQTQLGQPIGLILVQDAQINAFAVPGGLFALNSGLITSAHNMDEVAGVMAHEIAHVTQRHYSRSQEAFKGQGLLALAGMLVGALVASQADGNAGAAVMLGSQAAMMDKQLTYNRNQEREADRIGMQYMYSAGYNPHSMADFFELMNRSKTSVSYMPDFWLTHPLTTERMSEARLRANQLPQIKAKLRDEDFEILKWFTAVVAGQVTEQQLLVLAEQKQYAAQLALASFYHLKNDYHKAQEALNQALQHQRLHNLQTLIQTDIYLGQNKLSEALKVVQSAARIMPENRALNYKWAEVLLRQKKPAEVYQVVQHFTQRNPRDVQGWQLLQQAAQMDATSPVRAAMVLRYRAEVEYWSGKEEEAIKSLLHAQRLAENNQSLLAQLKSRVQQMQNERSMKI